MSLERRNFTEGRNDLSAVARLIRAVLSQISVPK
jgi:hypothetical protein